MIHPDSRSIGWLKQVANKNNYTNITLIEKTIRAFSLLESLVLSGCPFVFKGGTSLMLHLNSAKRLSIDIDIVCPPNTDIEKYLSQNAEQYGFNNIKLVERQTPNNITKSHAKFFYQVAYTTNTDTEYILLDVIFENNHYNKIEQLPIASSFLKTEGKDIFVNVPSNADLLGDKLTAFAPNTTGIPYFKNEKSRSMEIIKQLFDIASLFNEINDLSITASTFRKFAKIELGYRNLNTDNIKQVLDDIFQTSLCICLQGTVDKEHFNLLQDGIKRIQSFIHSERYYLDKAVTDASKAAYLSVLLDKNINEVKHFDENLSFLLDNEKIELPLPTKLNKLKKNNLEAFFFWNEIHKLLKQKSVYF
ncbi:MAG: nucleotidyl transferase AbiEii/AbiGii toxin family protein [Prevotellaceae bacterium]|jgi:predicted nucleotidyltransferase component of viral defense system|nr:nucleotidyl transferase AbiEii/AbiGii toxin family protein [Prevotellaceae bacterium]